MTVLLWLLGISGYLCAGRYLGAKSYQVWENSDNDSLAAKLLYPHNANAVQGTVGQGFSGIIILQEMFEDYNEGTIAYLAGMPFFWPIKALLFVPGITLFSMPKLFGGMVNKVAELRSKRLADTVDSLLPAADDDVHIRFEKARQADSLIRELVEIRQANLTAIEEDRMRFEASVEAEKTSWLDVNESPLLTEGAKEDRHD